MKEMLLQSFRISILVLCTLIGSSTTTTNNVQAQNLSITETTDFLSTFLSECASADTLSITIENPETPVTATNLSLVYSLPNTIEYVSYIPSANIISVDDSDISALVFNLSDLAYQGSSTVQILARAKCGANGESELYSQLTANYQINGVPNSDVGVGENLIGVVKKPSVQFAGVTNMVQNNGLIGQSFSRSYSVTNTGILSALEKFTFESTMEEGVSFVSLLVDGIEVTPAIDGNTISYEVNKLLRNLDNYPNDEAIIEEVIMVNACTNPNVGSTSFVRWGCDNATCEQEDLFPNIQTPVGIPAVVATLGVADLPACWSEMAKGRITLTNNGTGTATNIQYNLLNDMEDYNNNYIVESSFTIQKEGEAVQALMLDSATGAYSGPHCYSGGGIINTEFAFTIDFMQPGETFYVDFDFERCVLINPNPACNNKQWFEVWESEGTFGGTCNFETATMPMLEFNAEAFHWTASLPDAPLDMDDGDEGTFEINYTNAYLQGFTDDGTGHVAVEIDIPLGLCLPGTNDFAMIHGVNTKTLPTSVEIDDDNGLISLQFPPQSYVNNRILFDVVACCNALGGVSSGWQNVTAQTFFESSDNCTSSNLHTLHCQLSTPIRIQCGAGCDLGGMRFLSFSTARTTFGQADNDDNGQADGSGSLDMSKVRTDRLFLQDEFTSEFRGTVVTNENSPQAFDYGYAEVNMPLFGSYIDRLDAAINIYDASTGNTYTCSEVPFTVSTSGETRTWRYDFSVDELAALPCTDIPMDFSYANGDSISVVANYKVNGSFSGMKVAVFDTNYYLTTSENGTPYVCNNYAVRMVAYGYNVTNLGTLDHTLDGCESQNLGTEYLERYFNYFYIGNNIGNSSRQFPYEYRQMIALDEMTYTVPVGYTMESLTVYQRRNVGGFSSVVESATLTPISTSGNTQTYDLSSIYTINGGSIPLPDEGIRLQFSPKVSANCDATAGIGNVTLDYETTFLDPSGIQRTTTANYDVVPPDINFQILGGQTSILAAVESVETVDIRLRNEAPFSDADHVFVSYDSPGGYIIVDSVYNITDNVWLTLNNDFWEYGFLGQADDYVDLRFYYTYNICQQREFDIVAGWGGCDAYPSSVAANPCQVFRTTLMLDPVVPEVQTAIVNKSYTYTDLCEEFDYTVSVSNRDPGVARNLSFDLLLPLGSNLDIIEGYSKVEYMGTVYDVEPTPISERLFRWDISGIVAGLEANGLRPYAERPANEYLVSVKLATACGFISGGSLQFISNADGTCGEPLYSAADATLPIRLNAALDYEQIYAPLMAQDTSSRSQFTIMMLNKTPETGDPTSSRDHYYLTLPKGYAYIEGSSNFTQYIPSTTEPTIEVLDGITRLDWFFADGIPTQDTMIWDIDFEVDTVLVGCDVSLFKAQTLTEIQATCVSSGETCGVLVTSKEDEFYFSQCFGSGSGKTAGLESNGDLASKIAKRKYQQRRTSNTKNIEKEQLIKFTEKAARKGDIQTIQSEAAKANQKSGISDLIKFIPEKGMYDSQAYISTPADLIDITNAEEVFAVDYFSGEERYGAILALSTYDQVYEHTKVICDRFSGATLTDIGHINIQYQPFIYYVLEQPDGTVEYGISFTAHSGGYGGLYIDNRWDLEDYDELPVNFNFQVWSSTLDLAEDLMIRVLDLMKEETTGLVYANNDAPTIPEVYVRKGNYNKGKLNLNIQNNNNATEVTLRGTYKTTETEERQQFEEVIALSGAAQEEVVLDLGSVYDIGFNVKNNVNSQVDVIYSADGTWFTETPSSTQIDSYEVSPYITNLDDHNSDDMIVERNVELTGTVGSYLSVVRNLRPRSASADVSNYNVLAFTAEVEGPQIMTVTVAKAGINNWDEQFKIQVPLSTSSTIHEIWLGDLVSETGNMFDRSDVQSVVFTISGASSETGSMPFELNISDVRFKNANAPTENILNAGTISNYPNPFNDETVIFFALEEASEYTLNVFAVDGRKVFSTSKVGVEGKNRVVFKRGELSAGIYFYQLNAKHKIISNVMLAVDK